MDFQQFYNSLPKFTRIYMISVFVTTFCITYLKGIPIFYYFFYNYEFIFHKLQLWRLVTNFLIVGKFSFNFLFFMLMIYNTLSKKEKRAVSDTRYAEFVMLLVYLVLFVIVSAKFLCK
jgi:hypothetical protein